jgi:hypothetical protein
MSVPDTRGDSGSPPGRRPRRFLKRKRTWAVLAAASAAVLAMGLTVPAALAVHDTGAFELDGNATNNPAVPGDDWDNVCHQVLGTDCSTSSNTNGASAVNWVSEPNPSASIFTGGGSKDPQDINNWAWKDAGGLPDKDNLLHSFAARYPNTSKGDVLFFGSDRLDNSGDAQQGFWFFQNSIGQNGGSVGGGTGFTGVHKAGDLLVISDFSNGGTTSTITVYAWDPTCTKTTGTTVGACGDANLRIKGTSASANCASAAANDSFCGIVNPTNGTVAPWPYTDKSGNSTYLQGEFYEGGVNLTALGLGNECFASVASETRSSTSTTATLKDFILGQFGGCGSAVTTQSSITGTTSIGTGSVSVSDSAHVTVSGVANWAGTVQFHLRGPIGAANEVSTDIGGPVTVSNSTPDASSATATVTAAGDYCWSAHFHATTPATGVPDADDNGMNECFTVTPVTPALATNAGPGPVQLGNPISDTATLTGTANKPGTPAINPTTAGGPAGGTITFTAFGPNNCTTAVFSTTVTVSGDGTYGPVSFTPTAVGTYHWAATYSGDPPNTNGTSHNTNCTDTGEDVTVTSTTAATSAQTWLPNDTGTVTSAGGAPLNGTLSIQLYTGATCASGSEVSGQLYTKTLTNAVSPQTLTTTNTSFTVSTSTSTSWLVTFTSNDPNVAGSSHCESTSLTITN